MRRFLGVLVAAALLLAACGDDGGDQGGADDGTEDTFDSPTEDLGDADEGIDGVHSFRVFYPYPPHRPGDVVYGHSPPVGGLHAGGAWTCGFYDEPLIEELAVHDLEHGVVWLSYAPDLADADAEVIHELVRANEKVLAAPYPGLDRGVAVVATAWARQLTLDSVDDPRLAEFVEQYEDGSQSPEQGIGCSQGLGDPIP